MSKSLNLVIYKELNGKLIEDNVKTILSQGISEALLDLIAKDYPLISLNVYLDKEMNKSFKIDCFDNSDIENILLKLKSHFKTLLSHEYENLIGKVSKTTTSENDSKESIVDILPHDNQSNSVELSIARFSILTGVINLFVSKIENLSSEASAVIKLG